MDTIRSILNNIPDFKTIKQLGKAAFLIENINTNEKFIGKMEPPVKFPKQKISRFVFNGSLPFQNELRIIKLFNQRKTSFVLPLINSDYKSYYIIPFIKSVQLNDEVLENKVFQKIGSTVRQINDIPRPERWWILKEKAFYFLEQNSTDLLKNIKRQEKAHNIRLTNIKNYFRQINKIKNKIKPRMIHGDLSDNNILVSKIGEDIFIIDWEDARLENKAIFLDLIAISFNYENFELNQQIISGFWDDYKINIEESTYFQFLFSYSYMTFMFRLITLKRWDNGYKKNILNKIMEFNRDLNSLSDFIRKFVSI